MTDWHNSELSFLGRPHKISLRLAKVVIHRLNFLLAFSVMAEYEPEEIGTSERVHEGLGRESHHYRRLQAENGRLKAVPST